MTGVKPPSKYCTRLESFCQYKNTDYCPTRTTHHPPPAPECRDMAHRILEESLSEEDKRR